MLRLSVIFDAWCRLMCTYSISDFVVGSGCHQDSNYYIIFHLINLLFQSIKDIFIGIFTENVSLFRRLDLFLYHLMSEI